MTGCDRLTARRSSSSFLRSTLAVFFPSLLAEFKNTTDHSYYVANLDCNVSVRECSNNTFHAFKNNICSSCIADVVGDGKTLTNKTN